MMDILIFGQNQYTRFPIRSWRIEPTVEKRNLIRLKPVIVESEEERKGGESET
jgi:hypothetical protein